MEHPWTQQGCTHVARKSELFPGELLPVELLGGTMGHVHFPVLVSGAESLVAVGTVSALSQVS